MPDTATTIFNIEQRVDAILDALTQITQVIPQFTTAISSQQQALAELQAQQPIFAARLGDIAAAINLGTQLLQAIIDAMATAANQQTMLARLQRILAVVTASIPVQIVGDPASVTRVSQPQPPP